MGHGASSIFWYGDKYQEQKFHIWDPKWVYLKNTLSHFCYVKNFAWSTAWSDGIFLERIWGGFDLAEGLFWQWIKALEWLGGTGGGRVTCASRVSLFLFSGEVQGLSSNSSRHPPAQSSSQALFLLSCSNPGKCGYKPNMYLSVTVPGKGQAQDTSTKDIPSPSSVPITDTKHWDADVALGAWKAVYPMFSSWVTKSSYLSLLVWKVPPWNVPTAAEQQVPVCHSPTEIGLEQEQDCCHQADHILNTHPEQQFLDREDFQSCTGYSKTLPAIATLRTGWHSRSTAATVILVPHSQ